MHLRIEVFDVGLRLGEVSKQHENELQVSDTQLSFGFYSSANNNVSIAQ